MAQFVNHLVEDNILVPSDKQIMKNKKVIIIATTIVILFFGTGFLVLGINQINSQKKELALLQQMVIKNNDQIHVLVQNNVNENAEIKSLKDQPTPTPFVETQYIPQSTSKNNTPSTIPTPTPMSGVAGIYQKIFRNMIYGVPGSTSTSCSTSGNNINCSTTPN
jgi:cell division protein FtsB